MTVIHARRDIPYIPLPNITETVLDQQPAPHSLTPTAFAVAFTEDGRIVMASNQKRGVEFAGGHRDHRDGAAVENYREVDPDDLEDIAVTAARELWEEAGCRVSRLQPLAYLRNQCSADRMPQGYRYPFPVSYQQFMIGIVTDVAEYEDNPECAQPVFLTRDEARKVMNPQQWALAEAAWKVFPELIDARTPIQAGR
ncbi:NUDIX domain-containing protein [Agrobacterium rubi]|nr:NUDIX domain-containing protein [Agrobacterium rubi]NTF23998.1 NUDIX domain-containing protein [Agrobacterium rubi]